MREHRDGGRLFWAATAAGWALIGYGVWGLLDERQRTAPASLARWFAGGVLLHDLVWVPLALAAGTVIVRVVPVRWRRPVAWAAATSAVLGIISWPLVRGYGRDPRNPSLLPRDYPTGLLVYLAITWVVAAVWATAASRWRRR